MNRALRGLSACTYALLHETDEMRLVGEICRICVEIGGYRTAWVGYAEHDVEKMVRPVAHAGFGPEFLQRWQVTWGDRGSGRGPTGRAIRTRRTAVAHDPEEFGAAWNQAAEEHGMQSSIALPLVVEDEVLGSLTIYSAERSAFDGEEVHLLESFAGDLAYGIGALRARQARMRAQREAAQELETTRLLLQAAKTLSSTLDLDEILSRLADVALKFTGLSRAFVNLVDARRRVLTQMIATGGMHGHEGPEIPFDQVSRATLQAILDRKTAILDFERPDTSEYDRRLAQANDARLVLTVPLLVGDEMVGQIDLDTPGERHQFTDRQIELVEGIASEAAVTVRNAQLHAKTQEAARLDEALSEVDASIHSTLEFEQVMQSALDAGLEALRCDAGTIELREADRWVVRYEHGFPELVGVPMADQDAPNATRIAASGGPLAIEDVQSQSIVNVSVGRLQLGAVLGVPLIIRAKLIGCVLFYARGARHFTSAEVDFVGKFGASVCLAVDNARLYDGERQMTERLREKDAAIRQTYVDVIDAATGGKLVLVTPEELYDALGDPVSAPEAVRSAEEIGEARRRLGRLLRSLDRPVRDVDNLLLAACEALTNAYKHGMKGVRWSLRRTESGVQVLVVDEGGGIDFKTLPKATLAAGFSTQKSLGVGFTIMLEVCDRLLLATEPGFTGVALEMGFDGYR